MIDTTLEMVQYDCPFIDTTEESDVVFSATQWEFDPCQKQLETRMVVEAPDREALDTGLQNLREHPNMHDCELISKCGGISHLRTIIVETDAMAAVRDNGGYITGPFHIEDGSEQWRIGFDTPTVADDALTSLDRHNDFTVVSRDDVELAEIKDLAANVGAAMTLIEGCRDLSETELRTLETAVNQGYFQSPRDATLGTLADRFEISKPAVSKTLRRGQRKVLSRTVEALPDLSDSPDNNR